VVNANTNQELHKQMLPFDKLMNLSNQCNRGNQVRISDSQQNGMLVGIVEVWNETFDGFQRRMDAQENQIKHEVQCLQQIKMYLQQITNPFGFLNKSIDQQERQMAENDAQDKKEQDKGDTAFHNKEKDLERKFDKFADDLAKKQGYN